MNNILRDEEFKNKFPIKLVKHNSEWVHWYEDEKKSILAKLEKHKVNLYHIGSTAIPNIYSKDIIDIILEIYESDDYHLHVRKKGDIEEVKFRDVLIQNPKLAKQYERLKLDLETTYKHDREGYTDGKTKLIKDIIKEYGLHN